MLYSIFHKYITVSVKMKQPQNQARRNEAFDHGNEAATNRLEKSQSARAIANDCYKFIMEMSTNASIVSEALKFVNQSKEKINTM